MQFPSPQVTINIPLTINWFPEWGLSVSSVPINAQLNLPFISMNSLKHPCLGFQVHNRPIFGIGINNLVVFVYLLSSLSVCSRASNAASQKRIPGCSHLHLSRTTLTSEFIIEQRRYLSDLLSDLVNVIMRYNIVIDVNNDCYGARLGTWRKKYTYHVRTS